MINSIDNVKPNGVGSLACDDDSDIANLPQFAEEHNLKLGTTCIVVDSGKVLMMKSDYSFHEI